MLDHLEKLRKDLNLDAKVVYRTQELNMPLCLENHDGYQHLRKALLYYEPHFNFTITEEENDDA